MNLAIKLCANLETTPLPKDLIGIIFEMAPPQTNMARILTEYKQRLPIFKESPICRFPNTPSLVIKQFVWGVIIGKAAPGDNNPAELMQMLHMLAPRMALYCRLMKNMCNYYFFMSTDAKFR